MSPPDTIEPRIILTWFTPTWQKFDIFSLTLSSTGFSLLQTMRSGEIPRPRNSLTLACVGFVLCSPVAFGWGTKDTWTEQKFSRPTRNWNWRNASTNGIPSISPMVPPSSMIHNYEANRMDVDWKRYNWVNLRNVLSTYPIWKTLFTLGSAMSGLTGILATRSTQPWIASVMCGTTYNWKVSHYISKIGDVSE